jgi:5-methylcytosine-specific restriction endonuclease McrA
LEVKRGQQNSREGINMSVSLKLLYNYGRLPYTHGAVALGGRLMWHSLQHDKSWVKDKNGYYCKFCGKPLENKRLRKFCPATNCEREYDRLFVQYDCWAWFRERVFKRDKKTCRQCGRDLKDADYVCDHIIPLFKGGRDWWQDTEMTNFQILCVKCNSKKTACDLSRLGIPKDTAAQNRFNVCLGWVFEKPVDHQLDKFFSSVNPLEMK